MGIASCIRLLQTQWHVTEHKTANHHPQAKFTGNDRVCHWQVYKAEHSAEPLRVYHLRYDDSAETDQFSAGLARERRALENLIADKSHMVLPANPDPAQVQPCSV